MEQFERAKRFLVRIENIYTGTLRSLGHDTDAYDDDVISFFIHCYHVRDWIIHLNNLGITSKQVDQFIDDHLALKVCADLANGSKHCKLTRSLRTGKQPHVVKKQRKTSIWLTGSGSGQHMESKYTISALDETYDALDLAQEGIALWSDFIAELETRNKSSKKDAVTGASS